MLQGNRIFHIRVSRTLVNWFMDLIVVVVGVLLALWTSEWAQGRHTAERLADVKAALHREMIHNYEIAVEQEAIIPCYANFSHQLQAQLLQSTNMWAGFDSQFSRPDLNATGLTYGIIGVMPQRLETEMWQSVKNNDVLSSMPIKELQKYQQYYMVTAFLNTGIARVEAMRDSLSGLVFPGPLAPQTRTNALRDIANFNNGIQRLDARELLNSMFIDLGLKLPANTKSMLADSEQEAKDSGLSCYKIQSIDVPFANSVP
ncbi:hypothetical protein HR45_03160 [Shewanella mangrovi]|uniref:Uncharacterized protein n=2 Tax=Shewanella mangrovi TaxID=1515746 RepID=A0A094JK64_9GAMM|nr:hypothetical protein HR45_03160 [Shewanella mangrovi]